MITHEKHIETILSIIMWDNNRKYYVGKNTIENFNTFMNKLDKTLRWYGLTITANDVVIYVNNDSYDEYISSTSSTEEDNIQLGRAYI